MKNRIIAISLAVMLALSAGLVGCTAEVPGITEYSLTVSSTEGGSVTSPGEGTSTYDEGAVVDLMAEADEGYRFVNWSGDVDTVANIENAITTITMNGDYTITAQFAPKQCDLTISSTEGGLVTTPGEGIFTYDSGTVVDLAVQSAEGYRFTRWTGDVDFVADVDAASTNVIMNDHYHITANFEELDPGTPFAGGSGTAGDPYQIANWNHLHNVRDYLDGYFILISDLHSTTAGYADLASPIANGGKGWKPIGSLSVDPVYWYVVDPIGAFTGSFDGQGYEIRDLFIDRPDEDGVGLFGCVDGVGVAENLGVVNAEVSGRSYVGALMGGNWGTVSNSFLTGSVMGDEHTGGLVGGNWGTVWNSYTTGSVTGDQHTGGLAGGNSGTVSDCYSRSNVSGRGDVNKGGVGGLVGGNWGTVWDSYATGSVTGDLEVGGLVGWQHHGTVSNSYSTGNVTGSTRVGGLVGANYYDCSVTHSYSTGRVSGDDHVGGLVGENYAAVSSSFWDIQTSGQSASDGGTDKITAEMKNFATFTDWDIVIVVTPDIRNPSYIWNIVDGGTYPFLSWEP
jgi:uncharacterized repeat protein (TIGR02543 family)